MSQPPGGAQYGPDGTWQQPTPPYPGETTPPYPGGTTSYPAPAPAEPYGTGPGAYGTSGYPGTPPYPAHPSSPEHAGYAAPAPYPGSGAYPVSGPYAAPYPYPTTQRTNGLAIASLVLGILWIYWVGSILALIFGYIARNQIRERGEGGDGLAVAGIVLGWIGVGILGIGAVVVLIAGASAGF